ncbi:MAG: hypothetical protein KJP15_01170 [Gammaproteobacteria bacterium]|nr:hypothetical protein [Gammaproteobacteria bacterium]
MSSFLLFFAVFNFTILFIGNILVTLSLDSPGQDNLLEALLVDVALLSVFALQHSIMASPHFSPGGAHSTPYVNQRMAALILCLKRVRVY